MVEIYIEVIVCDTTTKPISSCSFILDEFKYVPPLFLSP